MYSPSCFIGRFAAASPSLNDTEEIGPSRSFVVCVYTTTRLPPLKVVKRCGSLMKFTPALKSWPRPPRYTCHEKSSRN
jgi:hypothetical protein